MALWGCIASNFVLGLYEMRLLRLDSAIPEFISYFVLIRASAFLLLWSRLAIENHHERASIFVARQEYSRGSLHNRYLKLGTIDLASKW
mmetsp:Transcript_46061/g.53139  ORF Transcript_46061/g.53139 Transcript_46061/m.53139 type:complete len:89 (+) Transcript_46061:160-426(+)